MFTGFPWTGKGFPLWMKNNPEPKTRISRLLCLLETLEYWDQILRQKSNSDYLYPKKMSWNLFHRKYMVRDGNILSLIL